MLKQMQDRWWLIVCLGVAMLYGGVFGILFNCVGLLLSAAAEAGAIATTSIARFFTAFSLSSAFGLPLTSRFYQGKYSRVSLTLGIILCALAFLSMGLWTENWQWIVSAAVFGFFASGIQLLPALVINNWMHQRAGTAISVCLTASGIVGMVFSPFLSTIISQSNWYIGCIVMGAAALMLALPAALFLIRVSPPGQAARPVVQENAILAEQKTTKTLNIGLILLCAGATASGAYYVKMANFLP